MGLTLAQKIMELWPAAVMLASGGVFLAAGYSLEKRLLKDG